jgi:thioredoxin 1
MKTLPRLLIVGAVIGAAAAVMILRPPRAASPPAPAAPAPSSPAERSTALPRLLDLGATKCVPCKMMAPILEDLSTSMVDRLQVEFIDVWEKPAAAELYAINLIPTQIFFGPDGRELYRHEGFISKEDILAKWAELGFHLAAASAP